MTTTRRAVLGATAAALPALAAPLILKAAPAADPVVAAALEWAALAEAEKQYDTRGVDWADCPGAVELERRCAAAFWRIARMRPSTAEGVAMMARVWFFDQAPASKARFDRPRTWSVSPGMGWHDGRERRLMLSILSASDHLTGREGRA